MFIDIWASNVSIFAGLPGGVFHSSMVSMKVEPTSLKVTYGQAVSCAEPALPDEKPGVIVPGAIRWPTMFVISVFADSTALRAPNMPPSVGFSWSLAIGCSE